MNVVIQKFGAKVFTDGLQHAMKLPYWEFEDQRSGETLSILTKVRADVEKFMNNFINILFQVLIGVLFVFIYAAIFINWRVPVAYLCGILLADVRVLLQLKFFAFLPRIVLILPRQSLFPIPYQHGPINFDRMLYSTHP